MLKNLLAAAAAILCTAGTVFAAADAPGEAVLARTLQDRVAGKARDCIRLGHSDPSRIIARTAIIFDSAGALYVNRPSSGAESLSEFSTLVTKSFNGEICSGEAVRLVDAASGSDRGVIFLGKFVPYRVRSVERFDPVPSAPAGYR